jgi:hypothetical protein
MKKEFSMNKKNESGKSALIKGSLQYAWEEMKTLNSGKLKALAKIAKGYFKMKMTDHKTTEQQGSDYSLDGR